MFCFLPFSPMSSIDAIVVKEPTQPTEETDSVGQQTALSDFDYGSCGRDYARKRWPDEDTINLILEGRYVPQSRSEILRLIAQRFACIFHLLPDVFQNDPEIRGIADEQFAGHELRRPHSGQGETFFPWAKAEKLVSGETEDCA